MAVTSCYIVDRLPGSQVHLCGPQLMWMVVAEEANIATLDSSKQTCSSKNGVGGAFRA